MMILSRKTDKLELIKRCWTSGVRVLPLLFLTVFTLAGCYPATTSVQQ